MIIILGGAPELSLVFPPIFPLNTGVVGDSSKYEGEYTGIPLGWTRHNYTLLFFLTIIMISQY